MTDIVVIDDHQLFIDGLVNSFENDDEVNIVGSGYDYDSAIKVINRTQPDVLLLDVDLTGSEKNGVEILKYTKQKFPDVNVLMITGHCDSGLLELVQREGAHGYLMKNVGLADLKQAIISVAQGQAVFRYDPRLMKKESKFIEPKMNISKRAKQIIELIAQGYTVKEVAEKLDVATTTINDHLDRAKRKVGARNNCELVAVYGRMNGIG